MPALAAVVCAACHGATVVEQSTTVNYVLVAPGCSSVLPVAFSVDNQPIGTDTFRVAVASPRLVSKSFTVSPGQHVLGAQVVNGYVWAPKTVMVTAGTTVSDSLPFYCS